MPKKKKLDLTDHYTLIENPIHPEDEYRFETYGEDFEYVCNYDQNYVWTLVDGDEDEPVFVKGLHHVNRIYYVITKDTYVVVRV